MTNCPHGNSCSDCGRCKTAKVLWEQNTPFAKFLAAKYLKRRCLWSIKQDVVQAALFALWRAALDYRPEDGAAFTTFAWYKITAHMSHEVNRLSPFGRKGAESGLALPRRRQIHDRIAEPRVGDNGVRDEVEECLRTLPTDRHRDVVRLYYLEGKSHEEVGRLIGVCRQRVQQILADSFHKIRSRRKNRVPV